MFTSRFLKCRTVYLQQIIRPLGRNKINPRNFFDFFLTDICANNCIIKCFIGDNPKRANARDALSHGSYFPCEYCIAKGFLFHNSDINLVEMKNKLLAQKTLIQNQIELYESENEESDGLKTLKEIEKSIEKAVKEITTKKKQIVWPSETKDAEPRTREQIAATVDKLDEGETLSKDEAKGIVGHSLFLDIPYFNMIRDFPAEYLHSVCLGKTRKLLELTFDIGQKRTRNTKRKLSSVQDFNKAMIVIKFPKESSRRSRALDFSVMKGQEFRNITLFLFPIIIDCIEPSAKERRLWLIFSFMIRACVIPTEEFRLLDHEIIETCASDFYALYEKLFGVQNCTYYTHIIGSHLLKIRDHGPLTLTSAFDFESFYGEMRSAFAPGTQSPLKQIFQQIFLKRTIGHHCCEASIHYSSKETPMECNNLIYTFEMSKYRMYKIENVSNDTLECVEIGKFPVKFNETPTLNWSKIGVFKAGGVGENLVQIPVNIVKGKVMRVKNLLITYPKNVLLEK